MIRFLVAALLAFLPVPLAAQPAGEEQPFTSHVAEFDRFAVETATMERAERVALFRARFADVFPGFYALRGRDEARHEARIAQALEAYPRLRERILAVDAAFAESFATGLPRMQAVFPDFGVTMPVHLVHSMGEMDGGTRTIGGTTYLIFGADMIAQLHDAETVGPLLDHELFHMYHKRFFSCEPLWCSAWREGLATYVAERMNPGATDRQLLLHLPVSLREAVDPRFDEAMCLLAAKRNSEEDADYAPFFYFSTDGATGFPGRFGYYLGYRIARQVGEGMSLEALAKLTPEQVRPRFDRAITELADCSGTE